MEPLTMTINFKGQNWLLEQKLVIQELVNCHAKLHADGTKKEKIPKVQHFSNKSPAKGEKLWKRGVRVKEGKGKRKNKSEIEVPKLRVLCKSLT